MDKVPEEVSLMQAQSQLLYALECFVFGNYADHMEERAMALDGPEDEEEDDGPDEDGPQNDDWLSEYYGGSTPQTERERQIADWEEKRRIG